MKWHGKSAILTSVLICWMAAVAFSENWLSLQTGSTGLPGGAVQPLYIDNYGLLWMGGGGESEDVGFACFDGTSFLNVTSLYGRIFRGYGVQDLVRDAMGNLWVQTQTGYPLSGALMRLNGDKVDDSWNMYATALRLVIDPDNILYAGCWEGLYRFESEKWSHVPIPGFENSAIKDIQFDMNQDMWLLGKDGLFHKLGDTFSQFKPPVSFESVHTFRIDFQNNMWIINRIWDNSQHSQRQQLLLFQHGNWTILTPENSSLPDAVFEALGIDAENDVWLGTSAGVYILNGESLRPTPVEPLRNYHITSIAIDSSNTKWLGTGDGNLLKYDGDDYTIFKGNERGLQSNVLTQIIKDRTGRMWIGGNRGGLVVADGLNMTPYAISKLPDKVISVRALAVDSTNVVWAGLYAVPVNSWWGPETRYLLRIENGVSQLFTMSNSNLPDDHINDIFVNKDNKKWISTQAGVAVYDDEKKSFSVINSDNSGLQGNDVRATTIDQEGIVWIATNIGLNRFDADDWMCYTSQNSPLPDTTITAIAADEKNRLWIGTKNNLAVLEDDEWAIYTMDNSVLPSMDIAAFDFTKPDRKWIVTQCYNVYPTYDTGGGLVGIDENDYWEVIGYNDMNPLDAEYDDDGNLWVSAQHFSNGIDWPESGGGLYIYYPNGVQVPSFISLRGSIFPSRPRIPGPDSLAVPFRVAPNPALEFARILYRLDNETTVSFAIFDILGRKVFEAADEFRKAGNYSFNWNGVNNHDILVPSGVYICQIQMNTRLYRQKLTLLR